MKKLLILALVLTFALMAACGNGETADVTPADTVTADPAAPPIDPAEPAPRTGPDLGGRTVTINAWWAYMDEFIGENATEPDPATAENYLTDRMVWDNLQRLQADYNVTLRNVTVSWGETMPMLTTSVMAGDPVADIQMLYGWMTLTAMVGNLIMPVSEYTTPESDVVSAQRFLTPGSVFDGEIWNVIEAAPQIFQTVNLGVNLDVIQAVGMESPEDLLARGEWNWERFREIMQAVTRDTDGDGVVDHFGISGPYLHIIYQLAGSNAGPMIDDNLQYSLDHPNTMAALELFFEFFRPGGYWYFEDGGNPLGGWDRNMNAFLEGVSAFFPLFIWQLQAEMPTFNFTVMPWPAGPNNDRGYTFQRGFIQGITVPVGVTDPHDVWFVYEAFRSWPGEDDWLISEGEWEVARGLLLRETCVQRLIEVITPYPMIDLARTVPGFDGIAGDLAHPFWNGEMTVAQAVETFRAPRQMVIDDFFN